MRYIRFDNSDFKSIKYQSGHMVHPCAIPMATTTLKVNQLGIIKEDTAQS